MSKKKRERRKKCRHKYSLTEVQAKQVNEILQSDHWPSPDIHEVLNQACPSAVMPQIMDAVRTYEAIIRVL